MEQIEKILQIAEYCKGNPDEFISILDKFFKDVPHDKKGDAFVYIGLTLFNSSYFDLALQSWKYALKYFIQYHNKTSESACYTNIGVAYEILGDYAKAIEYQEKALVIKKDIGDKAGESKCYGNIGIAYSTLGDYAKAIEYQEKALVIINDIGDKVDETELDETESNCYVGLGVVYYRIGDYAKAIEYQEKALVIKKDIGDKAGESSCYGNIGNIYERLGDYAKAIEYQEKALVIKKDIGDKAGELNCYGNIGIAYYILEDYAKAIEYHEKSFNLAKKIGDKVGESSYYVNIGNICYRLGDYAKAIDHYEKALNIAKKIEDKALEPISYKNLGGAYYRLGDYAKAIDHCEKALNIAKESGDIYNEATVSSNLGIICNEQKPEISYNYFKRSIELIEIIGGRIIEEEYKMGFYANLGSESDAYQYMVPICLRLKNEKEAFEYAERSKSKAFLYLLAASNIRPSVPIVTSELKSLLDDEENYLIKLRQIQTRHSRSMTSSTVKVDTNGVAVNTYADSGGKEVDFILSELDKIYDKIERIDSEYVFLRRGRHLPLDKVQNILLEKGNNHDDTTLIEYFTTKDKVFIFVVSPREFHIETVQLSEEKLANYIWSYWREVVNHPDYPDIGNTWLELSDYLIKPISEYLSKAEIIYFVPHGLLHYVPMHALELNGDALIKSHAVAYSPSASLLQFYRNKGSGLLNSCASFGVVFKDEVEEIARLFNITPQLDATKNIVLENLNNDILHFSCHGYFNQRDPLSSGILLYSKDNVIIDRNILSAREIFNLKMNSELVTLSACQTGLNETRPGDELIGLTRALIYAGTSSVIVSLWSVDAQSTRELMVEFYKLLKGGKDMATSLQQAQIKIMQKEEYSHPYYWAPFILVGDWV
jgi:CHAT domain-containing protein/tetratricopeptide (TPR) repeat protein